MQLSVVGLLHRFETMAELEASCACLAAIRMSDAERAALRAMLDNGRSLVSLDRRDAYRLLNHQFNGAIYDGTANPHLRKTVMSVRQVQFRIDERLTISQREHEAVVVAILDRDASDAANAVRSHIITVRDTVKAYLEGATDL